MNGIIYRCLNPKLDTEVLGSNAGFQIRLIFLSYMLATRTLSLNQKNIKGSIE